MKNNIVKYTDYIVGFREFPDEISLLINISGCPNKCKGCHSAYLQENIGTDLTEEELDKLINETKGITCIGFMGGDQNPQYIIQLSKYVKEKYKNLHTGWYSGKDIFPLNHGTFDYIKLGPYIEELGPIDNPSTNQRMYMNLSGDKLNATFIDITKKAFWSPKPWEDDYYEFNDNVTDINQ